MKPISNMTEFDQVLGGKIRTILIQHLLKKMKVLMAFLWLLCAGTQLQANVIAYYTFDGHVQDATANRHDGATPIGVTYDSNTPFNKGQSLFWDDASQSRYVDLPVIRGLASNFTVTCWLNVPATCTNTGWFTVLANNPPQATTNLVLSVNTWRSTNKKIYLGAQVGTNSDTVYTGNGAFTYGGWHHVAFVRNGTMVTVYVDGVAKTMIDSTLNLDLPLNLPFRIGHDKESNAGCNWHGWMDDLAFWDEALDSSSIASLANRTVSPAAYMAEPARVIAYYPFDDGTGLDASGLDNDAALTGVSGNSDVPAALGGGQSLDFAGGTSSQCYADLPVLLELHSKFTMTCWAKNISPGARHFILSTANSMPAVPGFAVYFYPPDGCLKFCSINNDLVSDDAGTANGIWTNVDQSWHHLAFTRDGSNVVVFVDGVRAAMQDGTVNADFMTSLPLRLGANFEAPSGYHWRGRLDDVAIWNGVVSDGVIANLAKGTDSPTNHVVPAWWKNYYVNELGPFYRYQTVGGANLDATNSLNVIPDFLTHAGDFPYQKKPYSREGYFVDQFFFTAILGGWATNGVDPANLHDVARRNPSTGVMEYDWALLDSRINPYFASGCTKPLLSLGDVCWDFPNAPQDVTTTSGVRYGQRMPPSNLAEWVCFITDLCVHLNNTYGAANVAQWMFKMPSGDPLFGPGLLPAEKAPAAKQLYDVTVRAIRSVITNAEVGPYDYGGDLRKGSTDIYPGGFLDMFKYMGTNQVPCDYACREFYGGTSDPDRYPIYVATNDMKLIDDALGYAVPFEIHQFDVSGQGAAGAAWLSHSLLGLYAEGVRKVMHWSVVESTADDHVLLSGQGWFYMLLDYMLKGDFYELPRPANSLAGTKYRPYAVIKGQTKYIVLSAYNTNQVTAESCNVTMQIPREMMSIAEGSVIKYVNTESNLYNVIRDDLAAVGNLKPGWEVAVGTIKGNAASAMPISTYQACSMINASWSKYVAVFSNSLALKPFASIGSISSTASNGYYTIIVSNVVPPNVTVIAINKK